MSKAFFGRERMYSESVMKRRRRRKREIEICHLWFKGEDRASSGIMHARLEVHTRS